MSRSTKLVAGSVAGLLVLGLVAALILRSGGPTTDDPVLEFGSAYPSAVAASGERHAHEIVAAPALVQVDGEQPTAVWAYNGSVPGPELRVPVGDTLVVDFRNELPQATTIHWHGVRVPNGMDGVPDLTQPPIEPGDTFRHEFTPPDAGTFWFHSHVNGPEQIDRGLYGTLVVEDPNEPAYERDEVWVLDDWLFDDADQILEDFDDRHAAQHNGRWGDVLTINSTIIPDVAVAPRERLRLRLVNASNGRPYAVDFGDLDAAVIAVDGMLTREPLPPDGFALAPGNRIDIDLTAPDQPGSYPVTNTFFDENMPLATIAVSGDAVPTPSFDAPTNPLIPAWSNPGSTIDREYVLEYLVPPDAEDAHPVGDEGGGLSLAGEEPLGDWAINGERFGETEPLQLAAGSFARLRLSNPSQSMHPIHLHGQFFKVLAVDGESVDEGHFRDTVLVESGQAIDIGLVATDAGTWAFHCHIQEHAASGMTTTIAVINA